LSLAYEAVAAQERINGWKREFEKVQAKRDAYRERAEAAEAEATKLREALEERDRLRVMLKEIGNQAANINHHCYQTGKLQCVACASSQELIEELARAALEGRE